MAKSVEQRTKLLVDSTTRCFLVSNWNEETASYRKDLDAPIFKKLGDIAALAKRFDAVADNFIKFDKRRQEAPKVLEGPAATNEKLGKQSQDLQKEIDEVHKDEKASLNMVDAKKPEDALNNWSELAKGYTDLAQQYKPILDKLIKVTEAKAKNANDGVNALKKELDAAKAGLESTNAELNNLEGQIRGIVMKYQKVAIDMDKKEIADAVRNFLGVFASN